MMMKSSNAKKIAVSVEVIYRNKHQQAVILLVLDRLSVDRFM